jgi:hypothetical protein
VLRRRRRRSRVPGPTDQINLTDEESRFKPDADGGSEQCYNAQAIVAADSLLVIASDVVQAANNKQQPEPVLRKLAAFARGARRARACRQLSQMAAAAR